MAKRIKVRVTLVVEVDAEAWQETYGYYESTALRQDIKDYALGCVQQSAGLEECYGTATLAN